MENTLLIVTADHGESLGQRGLGINGHGGPYQDGVRVPLILRLPAGERAGERNLGTVHLADIAPTILDWIGLDLPSELPGRSLLRPIPDDRPVQAYSPDQFEILVQWPRKLLSVRAGLLQVDLQTDPGELAPEPLEQAEFDRLREQFLEETGRPGTYPAAEEAREMTEEERVQIEDTGYAAGGD